MNESTKYPYSLRYSIATILLMLILLSMLGTNVIKAGAALVWILFGLFAIGIICLIALLVVKRLIPAIRGYIALELNDTTLIDYIRNVTIEWKDIKGIKLTRGRSASTLRIYLKWESDYGSEIAIPLRWVKGKDDDIYDAVVAYFEQDRIGENS